MEVAERWNPGISCCSQHFHIDRRSPTIRARLAHPEDPPNTPLLDIVVDTILNSHVCAPRATKSAGDALLRTESRITIRPGNGSGAELLPLSWPWKRNKLVHLPGPHPCTETLTCRSGKLLWPTSMLVGGKKTYPRFPATR